MRKLFRQKIREGRLEDVFCAGAVPAALPHARRRGRPPDDETLQVGGATIHIESDPNLPLPRADIVDWVRRAAVAVTSYLGRFPVNTLY